MGAALIIFAGVLLGAGVWLPWSIGDDGHSTGLAEFRNSSGGSVHRSGSLWIFAAVALVAFGSVLLIFGRVLELALITVGISVLSLLAVLYGWRIVNDDLALFHGGHRGAGLVWGAVGVLVAVAGSIVVIVRRPAGR